MNSYRCLYDTDTGLVPGGCGDPDQIEPGPAPASPTQNDKDARDSLIAAQEELLNVYRCQFEVDTQLVPGGCQNETPETEEEIETPATGTRTAISAGQFHSCGIKADGTVACWGGLAYGKADAPDGVFTAISSGWDHSCGIKADGTAVCWGGTDTFTPGHPEEPSGVFTGHTDAPDGVFTAISAGGGHSCGIKADGTVACWGYNTDGQLDAPDRVFTAISAGSWYSCGIKADGTAVCWGENDDGQLDAPDGVFTAISAGGRHSCGIKADGTVACWGSSEEGRLDAPDGVFTAISAGLYHSCGIKADGTAVCWGWDTFVQFDAPEGVFGPAR